MVLAAAGVNCDRESVEACRLAGARVELVHLNQLLGGERRIQDFGMLVLPGGFSYGDHLGAGAMLATIVRYRLLEDLQRFVADGRPVLGICNGFQVLARLGLLGDLTLVSNASGRFECRWVPLRVERSPCVFLQGLETLELPIAHGQGRVVVPDGEEPAVRAPLRYVENPNGSMGNIAGVCNEAGNVFGLMPHPERYVDRYHHPWWVGVVRERPLRNSGSHHPSRGSSDGDALPPPGLALFQNAVRYVREVL
jgi:phosphoribosylformylglycinamidine synthase